MRSIIVALVALCAACAGQSLGIPPGQFNPAFEEQPTEADFAYYPEAARGRLQGANVQLCCTPQPDRRLDCTIGAVWPVQQHFEEAALRVVRKYKMTEASYQAFRSDPGHWIQIPMTFRIIGAQGGMARARHLQERSAGICGRNRTM